VNLIILLNFLIAVISQTYENVMSKRFILVYQHKATMNLETLYVKKFLSGFEPFNFLVFSFPKSSEEGEEEEWDGLLNRVKKHVSSQSERVVEQVRSSRNESRAEVAKLRAEMKTLGSNLMARMDQLKEALEK